MSDILSRGKYRFALEMIEFQDSQFGTNIEALVTKIQGKILDNTYDTDKAVQNSTEVKDLAKVIFNRIGLNANIVTDDCLAAILPFYSNVNHVFINDFLRGWVDIKSQNKFLRDNVGKSGYVNTEKAKLGGIFSEHVTEVYINFINLTKVCKLSPPEITAVILHELGHGFYVCEYSDRLESTNQVLANISKSLNNKKDKIDIEYIYSEFQTINPKVTKEEIEKLATGNRIIAGYTWFKTIIGCVQAQLANNKYDDTAFEQLADNFSARFGYGRPLVTALDKIHLLHGDIVKDRGIITMYLMMQTFMLIAMPIVSIIMIMGGAVLGIVLLALMYLVLYTSGENFKNYTYDELRIRYKRARNECVESLKRSKGSNASIKAVLDDIYAIDKIMTETYQYRSIFNTLSNYIFKVNRDAANSIEEQQLLEELAFNDLFIKSRELSVS